MTSNLRNALDALGHQVTIAIRVTVDANGAVKHADFVSSSQSMDPRGIYIRTAALQAAGLWRFTPGKLDGRNVPGDYTIQFTFR
jgi:outer membrane biosynthesis protein TonB